MKDRWCRLVCRLIPESHGTSRLQSGQIARSVNEIALWRRIPGHSVAA
jgi:hypothetical protein